MHHRKSPRASWYDYSSSGGYFVTICTKDREHYFGEIQDGNMILNPLGLYCDQYIQDLVERRKTVDIHERVVMPNHIHLLLAISEFTSDMVQPYVDRRDDLLGRLSMIDDIRHAKSMSLQDKSNPTYQGPTLGSIINMLKGAITKYAHTNDMIFARQGRYHDHIIRNEGEYERIKHYIQTNPEHRDTDSLQ